MIELTGISLGERQRQLNAEIRDAAKNEINFSEIKSQAEKSDVDKLYKIGVASKYKNIEYIIEILKSGDSLYISKALKCIWLYSNEYSHIINPEYLHENIFPLMSLKMTKKFLTAISMHLRDERAKNFFSYCNKMKLKNIAMKFLIFTPELFKLEILKDVNVLYKLRESNDLLTVFLGNSFDLAEVYYNTASENEQASILYQLRHFYSISDVKYLELLRKSNCHWSYFKRIGLRISKDIMNKHKNEIYKNPMKYIYLLNKSMLVRYSTVDDAKFYFKTIITHEYPEPADFWNMIVCEKYDYILNKIPSDQRLKFIKHIFSDKYPNVEFEMSIQFYNAQLYKLMTPEEKEKWALKHVQNDLELLGSGREFLWYRFVSFEKAFDPLKKYIQLAVNTDARSKVISVLVKSAKTDRDLSTLFDYYFMRHVNEQQYFKERFVDTIISEHNVCSFGELCWNAFNKILYSLEVYNILEGCSCKSDYKYIALIYHIIHGKEVPEALRNYIDSVIYLYAFKAQTDKLSQENIIIVYEYLLQFYLDKIQSFDQEIYNDEVKLGVRKYIKFVLDLLYKYEKPKEDVPEIVNKYIQLDFDEFRYHVLIKVIEPKFTQERLIGYLKKNKDVVISSLPLIKNEINDKFSSFKFNKFLKKVRIYFLNDLSIIFLAFFKEILDEQNPSSRSIKAGIYGIFELTGLDFKIDFISKYAPEEAKIDHSEINPKFLCIQEAICNLICYSRPPVPLSDITKYIKGDYVHYCLPMFHSYLANLPKPLCLEFVKSLLDKPLSVQKHGLRMAFECFNLADLRKIISEAWSNTINVPLRSIIYTYVHNKIQDFDEHDQNELFEDFKSFTRSLSHEDDLKLFSLIKSNFLPKRFISEYIEIAWSVVDSFPTKNEMFIECRRGIIDSTRFDINFIKKEVIEAIIYDHLNHMFKQEKIKRKYKNFEEKLLVRSKWNLLQKYVTFYTDEDDFHKKSELVMVVIKESIKMWDEVDDNKYIIKEFIPNFVNGLYDCSYDHEFENSAKMNVLFELILKELQDSLSPEEIYEIFWSIRICILTRNVVTDKKKKLEHNTNHCVIIIECLNTFAKEFAKVFIKATENRQCFVSLFDVIRDILELHLYKILMYRNYNDKNQVVRLHNTYVSICLQILEYESLETYMFAAKLLPCNIGCIDREDYLKVINKLKSGEYKEIIFYLYRKFVNLDYKYRDYIMLPQRQEIK